MSKSRKRPVGRRGFLKGAAASAAAIVVAPHAGKAKEAQEGHDHQAVPSDMTLRVKALESLLVEKGLADPATLDQLTDSYGRNLGPQNGAKVIARAWVDPAFKKRLLTDAVSAVKELGFTTLSGENQQHVYSVSFAARELWGGQAPPRDVVHIDLWDDYLERA